ncbi:hypothetical protein TELCIR_20729, partial [Teladorsagia circumcincta]
QTTTRRPPPSPPTNRPPPPPPTNRPPPTPPTNRPPPPPPTSRPPSPPPTNRLPPTSRPNNQRCGPNEVFDSCGSACEPSCRDPNPDRAYVAPNADQGIAKNLLKGTAAIQESEERAEICHSNE